MVGSAHESVQRMPSPAPFGKFLTGAGSVLVLDAIWMFYLCWVVPLPSGLLWLPGLLLLPYVVVRLVVVSAGWFFYQVDKVGGQRRDWALVGTGLFLVLTRCVAIGG
jgi:hypothetical protein